MSTRLPKILAGGASLAGLVTETLGHEFHWPQVPKLPVSDSGPFDNEASQLSMFMRQRAKLLDMQKSGGILEAPEKFEITSKDDMVKLLRINKELNNININEFFVSHGLFAPKTFSPYDMTRLSETYKFVLTEKVAEIMEDIQAGSEYTDEVGEILISALKVIRPELKVPTKRIMDPSQLVLNKCFLYQEGFITPAAVDSSGERPFEVRYTKKENYAWGHNGLGDGLTDLKKSGMSFDLSDDALDALAAKLAFCAIMNVDPTTPTHCYSSRLLMEAFVLDKRYNLAPSIGAIVVKAYNDSDTVMSSAFDFERASELDLGKPASDSTEFHNDCTTLDKLETEAKKNQEYHYEVLKFALTLFGPYTLLYRTPAKKGWFPDPARQRHDTQFGVVVSPGQGTLTISRKPFSKFNSEECGFLLPHRGPAAAEHQDWLKMIEETGLLTPGWLSIFKDITKENENVKTRLLISGTYGLRGELKPGCWCGRRRAKSC